MPWRARSGRYASRHIADDAERIRARLRAGRDVYVYYNNDLEGHAVDNARQLIQSLRIDFDRRVTAPDV
jgi:uncharacterized protein YecE (DUF72 family)